MALSINTDLSKFDIPTSNTGGSLAQEFGSYCLLSQQIRLEDNFRNEKIPTSNGRFKKKEKINVHPHTHTHSEIRILSISMLGFLD